MRIFVPKMGRNFVFGSVLVFPFFVFRAKLGTTNTRQNGLSDIKNKSPFSRNSNDLKFSKKNNPQCPEKSI